MTAAPRSAPSVGGRSAAPPRLRADAQRNRDSILRAARETFEAEGVLAALDAIAVRAGVGNATLYRNFPTRDDLLAAVVEMSVADAVAMADELARSRPPGDALAEWLVELAWRLRIWHDLPYCIAVASREEAGTPLSVACDPLLAQTGRLLDAARATGRASSEVTPDELFELVTSLSWGIDRFGDDETAARRRVRMATAGIFT